MTPSTSRALGLLVLTMTAVTPLRAQVPAPAPAPPPAPQPARAATATDANTPLHLLKADYPVPYGPITPEKITEVLLRVRGYLEAQTPARIVDRATGQPLADLARPGAEPIAEPGAFRRDELRVGRRLLRHAPRRGDDGRPRLQGLRGPAPRPRRHARRPLPGAPASRTVPCAPSWSRAPSTTRARCARR